MWWWCVGYRPFFDEFEQNSAVGIDQFNALVHAAQSAFGLTPLRLQRRQRLQRLCVRVTQRTV